MFKLMVRFCTNLRRIDTAPCEYDLSGPLADFLGTFGRRLQLANLDSLSCNVSSIIKILSNCPNARFEMIWWTSQHKPEGVRALGDRIRQLTIGEGVVKPEDVLEATRD